MKYMTIRGGEKEKEKRRRKAKYDMQDGSTSRCLCLASLGPDQDERSAKMKAALKGVRWDSLKLGGINREGPASAKAEHVD